MIDPIKVDIYEVNYSVSPGGIDRWEMNVWLPRPLTDKNYAYFDGFKNANEALEFVMKHYPTRELNVRIRSLEWYRANEERLENARI